jgi:hypothetical protein
MFGMSRPRFVGGESISTSSHLPHFIILLRVLSCESLEWLLSEHGQKLILLALPTCEIISQSRFCIHKDDSAI